VRDWATADALRAEIESAGWRVVDAGVEYRLEPANPPDVEVGGEIRYGRSDAVPSRLGEPASRLATVALLASPDVEESTRSLRGLLAGLPAEADAVIVADGLHDAAVVPLAELAAASGAAGRVETVRTSEPLGRGAALNIAVRRASGSVVIALDAGIEPAGDVVTPLAAALDEPAVAVAGPFGLVSRDLRHFDEVIDPGPVTAIQGYVLAFRRDDAARVGPVDEAFRFYRNLDIWWSLALRDAGEAQAARSAVVVAGLPLVRHEPWAWRSTPPAERERLSRRNFYRILDRYRTRLDLAT